MMLMCRLLISSQKQTKSSANPRYETNSFIQSPYSSINSRTPSTDLAARGSKITLNGRGWVFADSVKARSSIGAERSDLTLNAHWISAVLTNTELLYIKKFEWDNEFSKRIRQLTR